MYDDVLLLPGLWNSGPKHWQSFWEARFPEMVRVMQTDWETPSFDDWSSTLERIVASRDTQPVLVAHSLACTLVARWAQRTHQRVRGALLVGPSDVDAPAYPKGPTGFAPMPLERIPFPTIVVASDDDPYVAIDRARFFAQSWGSAIVEVSRMGHLNSDSNMGDWPEGLALVRRLQGTASSETV